eukprot:5072225-Pleurochrysis_carterae.AAC.6
MHASLVCMHSHYNCTSTGHASLATMDWMIRQSKVKARHMGRGGVCAAQMLEIARARDVLPDQARFFYSSLQLPPSDCIYIVAVNLRCWSHAQKPQCKFSHLKRTNASVPI